MQVVTRKLHIRIIHSLIDKLHFGVIWLTTQKKKKALPRLLWSAFLLDMNQLGAVNTRKSLFAEIQNSIMDQTSSAAPKMVPAYEVMHIHMFFDDNVDSRTFFPA